MSKTLITDIDGTITDHWCRIRRNTVPKWPGGKIDPKAFTRQEVLKDKMVLDCQFALWDLEDQGYQIRYLTARGWPGALEITREQLRGFMLPNPDDVTIVNSMREKFDWLKANPCDVYIDDFMTGQENAIGTFHRDIACFIDALGIKVVVFRNDWQDALEQVLWEPRP